MNRRRLPRAVQSPEAIRIRSLRRELQIQILKDNRALENNQVVISAATNTFAERRTRQTPP